MSRKDTGRNNKFKKIISKINDIEFGPIIKSSSYDVTSKEEYQSPEFNEEGLIFLGAISSAILLGLLIYGIMMLFALVRGGGT
tara:strand:- start:280 stop:528 length:249 start_codon:yes stop_codon:yes gene_type:complete